MNIKNFPKLYPKDILKIVESVTNTYWPDKSIPVNIELIIERAKLEIIPEPLRLKEHEVDATLVSDFKSIIVDSESYNDDSYLNRVRFSLAHEFGHYILHKDFFIQNKINPDKSKQLRDDNNETLIYDLSEYQYNILEYQANVFAGFILVPEKEFKQYAIIDKKDDTETSRIFLVSPSCIKKRGETYYKMHKEFLK